MQTNEQLASRICQGDIYRDVDYIEYVAESRTSLDVSRIRFPLVIVLTQDCDLEQERAERVRHADAGKHRSNDKALISVLVAPLYNAEHFQAGKHLSELGLESREIQWKRTEGNSIRQNSNPRYHYIDFGPTAQTVPSVIDFKHYFSANLRYLETHRDAGNFVCSVPALYREAVSHRFAHFLSRIALPDA